MHRKFPPQSPTRRDNLGDLDIHGRIILESILEKLGVKVRDCLGWFKKVSVNMEVTLSHS
jgi:hypothetical protein